MLKLFAYGHLEREDLLAVSRRFHDLAHQLVEIDRLPGDRMNVLHRARHLDRGRQRVGHQVWPESGSLPRILIVFWVR